MGDCEPEPRPVRTFPARPLFLDRDGVLNEDPGYVHRWEDSTGCRAARGGGRFLQSRRMWVFVVTNQSGVGQRAITPRTTSSRCMRGCRSSLAEIDAHIDAYYYCPAASGRGG